MGVKRSVVAGDPMNWWFGSPVVWIGSPGSCRGCQLALEAHLQSRRRAKRGPSVQSATQNPTFSRDPGPQRPRRWGRWTARAFPFGPLPKWSGVRPGGYPGFRLDVEPSE